MAKGKNCRKAYTSKGQRKNVAEKFEIHSLLDKAIFKAKAKNAKKRTCQTIENPDKEATNKRFIRVCN